MARSIFATAPNKVNGWFCTSGVHLSKTPRSDTNIVIFRDTLKFLSRREELCQNINSSFSSNTPTHLGLSRYKFGGYGSSPEPASEATDCLSSWRTKTSPQAEHRGTDLPNASSKVRTCSIPIHLHLPAGQSVRDTCVKKIAQIERTSKMVSYLVLSSFLHGKGRCYSLLVRWFMVIQLRNL